ncbi:hypothetical protein ScPMuIL_000383 [Solemya velum]
MFIAIGLRGRADDIGQAASSTLFPSTTQQGEALGNEITTRALYESQDNNTTRENYVINSTDVTTGGNRSDVTVSDGGNGNVVTTSTKAPPTTPWFKDYMVDAGVAEIPCSVLDHYFDWNFRFLFTTAQIEALFCKCYGYCQMPTLSPSMRTHITKLQNDPLSSANRSQFITIVTVFSVVFLVGVVGNVITIVGLTRWMKTNTPTFLFILSLSCSDLLLLLVCPPLKISEYFLLTSVFNSITCKLMYYVRDYTFTSSVLTLTVISFERFYAICYPLKVQLRCSLRRARVIILTCWLVSAGLSVPTIFAMKFYETSTDKAALCLQNFDDMLHLQLFFMYYLVILFAVPVGVMAFTYGRSMISLWNATKKSISLRGKKIRHIRGPLEILKEEWEEPSDGKTSVVSFILETRDRMRAMRQLVCMNEKVSKKKQKTYYDRKARHRVLERGQKVLLLLPTSKSKLLAQWKGPYEVVERVSPVDYRIRLSNKEHVYHINMLKRWFDREDPDEKSVDIAKDDVISCLHVISALASGESAVDEEPNEIPSLSMSGKETVDDVTICSDLTREQVGELESLLSEFSDVLSDVPKQTSLITHSVKTTTDIPIHRKPYPIPYALQDKVKKELQQMKELGIIEDSDSPYSAPMVLVKRPEASLRICIDFRELNRVTVFDPRPMPRMDDVLNRLGKAKYLSKIDLTKGYWQVPLDEDAKQKSSFVTPFGQYRFTVMPFGMVCAPATFVRLMAKVLQGYESFTEAFIDDIGVYSDTWNDHIEHLRLVFLALRESNLSAKPSKCSFGFPELVFLAHVVGNMMVKPTLDKLAIVQNFPQPLTKKQVKSFLGFVGFYRKFVQNFATLAIPLTDLTKKSMPNKVIWNETLQQAFESLKLVLLKGPVLRSPDFEKQFILRTDACDTGVGAVLEQSFDDGRHPVLYMSKKLSTPERNYAVIEKECYAIVWKRNQESKEKREPDEDKSKQNTTDTDRRMKSTVQYQRTRPISKDKTQSDKYNGVIDRDVCFPVLGYKDDGADDLDVYFPLLGDNDDCLDDRDVWFPVTGNKDDGVIDRDACSPVLGDKDDCLGDRDVCFLVTGDKDDCLDDRDACSPVLGDKDDCLGDRDVCFLVTGDKDDCLDDRDVWFPVLGDKDDGADDRDVCFPVLGDKDDCLDDRDVWFPVLVDKDDGADDRDVCFPVLGDKDDGADDRDVCFSVLGDKDDCLDDRDVWFPVLGDKDDGADDLDVCFPVLGDKDDCLDDRDVWFPVLGDKDDCLDDRDVWFPVTGDKDDGADDRDICDLLGPPADSPSDDNVWLPVPVHAADPPRPGGAGLPQQLPQPLLLHVYVHTIQGVGSKPVPSRGSQTAGQKECGQQAPDSK